MQDKNWTDNDMREWAAFYAVKSRDEKEFKMFQYFEEFKKEREFKWHEYPNVSTENNKDWEVIEKARKAHEGEYGIIGDSEWEIRKVKRLSDGEIFTVGEVVDLFPYNDTGRYHNCEIKGFRIRETSMRVEGINGLGEPFQFDIAGIVKRKRNPLFQTTDGKEIYEGDSIWFVNAAIWRAYELKRVNHKINEENVFSTEQAAKDYILMNKPCLTAKEVYDYLVDAIKKNKWGIADGIVELAKSKLDK